MDNSAQTEHASSRCVEVQEVLLEFMSRELGAARSDFVREHLRRCPDCQREAAAMQATIEALRAAAPAPAEWPGRLSDQRRDRIRWSIMHPVLDWIYRHHVLVSLLVAVIVLVGVFTALRTLVVVMRPPEPRTPEVQIGQGPPPSP